MKYTYIYIFRNFFNIFYIERYEYKITVYKLFKNEYPFASSKNKSFIIVRKV